MGPLQLPDHVVRIARIFDACRSPLGYALRGVASWEQDWMDGWIMEAKLTPQQMRQLRDIEMQVFGEINGR